MSGLQHTEKEFVNHDGLFSLTPYFTLVPEQLYREEDKDLWLNFLREHIPHNQQIAVEAIPLYGCVCLHQIDENNRQHCVAYLLEQSQTIVEQQFGMAYIADSTLVWIGIRSRQVQHANVYPIASATDVLYYMLNSLTQLDFAPETPVYLYGHCDAEWRKLLQEYLLINTK